MTNCESQKARRLEAERLCKKFPEADTRTLAKRLADEFSCTIEQARSAIRRIRGNFGDGARKRATVPRKNGTPGAKLRCPPAEAEAWEKFELGTGIRVAVLSDLHIPYHNRQALETAVKYCKERKPHVLFLNGDVGDWYDLSQWDKDPRRRDFSKELLLQRQALAWLRSEFPKARFVMKKGNHDERWDKFIWNSAPQLACFDEMSGEGRVSLDAWLKSDSIGLEIVGDKRPVMAGELPILHGHELPKGLATPVNPARGAYMKTSTSVLISHHHRTSQHAEYDMWKSEVVCWSIGCLCGMTPNYAPINRWNHGFGFVEVAASGQYGVENLRIEGRKVRSS